MAQSKATWTITALSACTIHTRKQKGKGGEKKGTKYSETQGLIPCIQEEDKDGNPTGKVKLLIGANGEVELAPNFQTAIKKVKDSGEFPEARFDRTSYEAAIDRQLAAEAAARKAAMLAEYDAEVKAEQEGGDESSESEADVVETSEEDAEDASDAE
tara:strand:+ start:22974 stop:23444 length:471 start_codon:yes stop_codon:yes gene_type:complete